jgi:hypothetical protein
MQYTRVYVDARGETHYEEVEVALSSVEFARLTPRFICRPFALLHGGDSASSRQAGLVPGI